MNHICYFYIVDYRSIHNMGISLDARYVYEMDKDNQILKIRKNPDYVEGFWPDGIVTLSALVGNNGAGKTTFLEAMHHMLGDGGGEWLTKVIIVCENSGILKTYNTTDGYRVYYEGKELAPQSFERHAPRFRPFYYSTSFRPSLQFYEPGNGELGAAYNATDTWKLVHDLLAYSNLRSQEGTKSLAWHLYTMHAQEHNRMLQMLYDETLRGFLPEGMMPQYIIIRPSMSGYYNLQDRASHDDLIKTIDLTPPKFEMTKEGFLANIVSSNFFNYAADLGKTPEDAMMDRNEWLSIYRNMPSGQKNKAREALKHLIDKHPNENLQYVQLGNVVDFLANEDAFLYNSDANVLYMDLSTVNNIYIKVLMGLFRNVNFIVARYFDMEFSRRYDTITQLSSGEQDMLKLFSRLYDALFEAPHKYGNKQSSNLILLDEAENSYHPEWQRQFVSRLLTFLHALRKHNKVTSDFQVVLTTHSPILLSDIPRMYVNYLEKKDKTGDVAIRTEVPETFGTNIFDLYRNSFFLHNGMVGVYASEKIERLQKDIKAGKRDRKELLREIDLIGDERIRAYMWALMEKMRLQKEKTKRERAIRRVRKG